MLTGVAMQAREGGFLNITVSLDGRYGVDLDVARIVHGRAAHPDASDEIVVGEATASALGVDVGDVLHLDSYSPAQVAEWRNREPTDEERASPRGPPVNLEIVGISRHPADLVSDDPLAFFTTLPPGFWRTYEGRIGEWFPFLAIDIGQTPTPAEQAAVAAEVLELTGPEAALEEAGEQGGGPLVRTLDFVGVAMLILAAAVGLAGFVVGGLVSARTVSRAADETENLSPLGMTPRDRAQAIIAALAPTVAASAVLAVAVAVASSAFLPFGLARRTEPHPGLRVDGAVLAAGAVATAVIVLAVIVAATASALRRGASERRSTRPGPVSRLVRTSLPVGPLCGLDLAVGSGRGRARGANWVAVVAVGLATIAGAAALVLAASVDRLLSTPAAYGWTWDFVVPDEAAQVLADDPAVASVGLVTVAPISLDGRPIMTRGISSLKGELPLRIVDGRPAERGEVVLGSRTMADLHVGIGDTVVATGSREQRELRVVGEAVFAGVLDVPEAGWGAALPLAEFDALGSEGDTFTSGIVALADGVDRLAFADRVAAEFGEAPGVADPPVELERLHEIESFPWLLVAFLVAVGFVALVHAIFVTIRHRRGDLAVLRSMGLARGGVYQAISAEAAVLAVAGAVVGVPLGVAAGQALWRGLASSLGVVVTVDVPWTTIIGGAFAACAAITALALLPARTAARAPLVDALRAE